MYYFFSSNLPFIKICLFYLQEIAIRAAFLEQENIQLKWEAARLKSETARLRTILLAETAMIMK